MKERQLQITIQELYTELKKAEATDDQAQEHIQILLKEIDALIQEPGEVPAHRYQQLLERLKESVRHFEASHLSLTMAVGRVIDALSNMGI
jgi:ElaB/YqjD/DUF883 family membrane-anchored ribosome-binding protein